jgi:capsular exopolysaccharide synthesis family protein
VPEASDGRRRAFVDPSSPSSEAFRTLRLALQLRGQEREHSVLLFTSAEPGVGKSTTAANFAVVSALGQARVLLIDADLRKPVQHEIFGLPREPGLVELLATGEQLSKLAQPIAGLGDLWVLTAGRTIARSGDLAASERMRALLADAAAQFDVVAIDSPPVLATADAEGIATHPGVEVLFVVDRSSRRRGVRKALRRLELIEANVEGILLNREGRVSKYAGAYGER